MNIERINDYSDTRFGKTVLTQHGAFLADGIPCEFEIIDNHSAKMLYRFSDNTDAAAQLIDEFRFYAGHINRFFDGEGRLIKEFAPAKIFSVPIGNIQPSQFFVDEDKLSAVSSFVNSAEDVVIPLFYDENLKKYVSLDGHTRLVLALERGYIAVNGFLDDTGDYIGDFVGEARKRGIFGVKDIKKLPHSEYEIKWNKFCDNFFADKGSSRLT